MGKSDIALPNYLCLIPHLKRNDEGITLQGEPAWADVVRSRAKNVRDEKRLKMLLGEAPPPGKLKLSRTDSKVIVHESR